MQNNVTLPAPEMILMPVPRFDNQHFIGINHEFDIIQQTGIRSPIH